MAVKSPGQPWRVAALVVLCCLVYYFSYDQGREAARGDLEALRQESSAELGAQRQEIARLRQALTACAGELAPAEPPQAAKPQPAAEKLTLREGQSQLIFDGRLVVTLLQVASTENRALVQLNFLEEGRLVTESLGAGASLKFNLDDKTWVLVANTLSVSSAVFNLLELKP